MDLSNEQYAARKAVHDWYRERDGSDFFLAGYAGTGKTTLIKHMLAESHSPIAVLAPTNKAARVLREKGIPEATTIHSFLYGEPVAGACECGTQTKNHDKKCPALKLTFLPRGLSLDGREIEELPPSLIVVDEASMVNEKIANDLRAKGVPILAVGDPFQLPPVDGRPGWTTPDFEMTTIQRQAAENPIIRLAHGLRMGKSLPFVDFPQIKVTKNSLNKEGFDTDDWDQIVTWRHTTRCLYNAQYRALLGKTSPLPMPGEDVMFKSTHKTLGIANGDVYGVDSIQAQDDKDSFDLRLVVENDTTIGVSAWKAGFGDADDWKNLSTMEYRIRRFHAQVIYSYAITCHSSQGSEWPRVIIAQEGNREARWLYTALTRAKERALVCLGRD